MTMHWPAQNVRPSSKRYAVPPEPECPAGCGTRMTCSAVMEHGALLVWRCPACTYVRREQREKVSA